MKELSVEEKAKAYDEAIEKSKEFYILCKKCGAKDTVDFLEDSFPELRESEDEKIRKKLKHYLEVRRCQTQSDEEYINCNNFLAWLEKQGKEDSSIQQAYEWGYTEGKRIERKHWIEKQNFSEDYNSIDPQFGKPINKVEPKFKVGDWCIDNEDGTIFQIVKVLDNTYTYKTNEGKEYSCSHYSLENDAHLWTIQDAKDGDVLACNEEILLFKSYSVQGRISLYCWYNGQTNNFHSKEVVDTLMTTRNKIYPATKEQRDLLFQKMKEAGYKWDEGKKELKKIEKKSQRMISAEAKEALYDKPTDNDMVEALRTEYEKGRADAIAEMQKEWSEEDEQYLLICKNALAKYQTTDKWDADIISCWLENKLKAPQTAWKPSDEQMEALHDLNLTGNISYAGQGQVLIEFYNDLKKLKGE